MKASSSARLFGGTRFRNDGWFWPPLILALGMLAILRVASTPRAEGRGRPATARRAVLGIVLAGVLAAAASCGGGSSASSTSGSNPTGPAEAGFVTVTGTSGALSHTTQVTISVN